MSNIYKIFNLNDDFTLEELKDAYINLKKNIKNNYNFLEFHDKEILFEKYKELYETAKYILRERDNKRKHIDINQFKLMQNQHDKLNLLNKLYDFDILNRKNLLLFERKSNLFDKMDKIFDKIDRSINTSTNTYSYNSSYKSILNPDGSNTVIETKTENKNGEKNDFINAYKKMPNGEIVPFSSSEIKQIQLMQNSNTNKFNKKINQIKN
jgi:hypothetical protein